MEKIAWLVLELATLICAVAVYWMPGALFVGRIVLGVYYVFAGALVNAVFLFRGDTFAVFADSAHLSFVRDTWRSVVAPHHVFFIGLLIVFEATMGLLVFMGRRLTVVGMVGILGMQVGLLFFGWVLTVSAAVMLFAVGLLLRAQLDVVRDSHRQPASDPSSG